MPSPNETFPTRPAARAFSFVLGHTPGPGKPGQAPQAVASPFPGCPLGPKCLLQTKRPPPGPPRGPFPLFSAIPPGRESPGRPRRPSPPRSPAAPLGQEGQAARKPRKAPQAVVSPFPGRARAGKAGKLGKPGQAPQAVASPFPRPHPWPKCLLQTKRPPPGPPRGPLPLFSAIPPDREARKARKGPASRRLPFPGCPLGPKMPSPNETSPTRPAARAFSFVLGNTLGPGNPGRPRKPPPPRSPAAPLGRKGREARETREGPAGHRLPVPRLPPRAETPSPNETFPSRPAARAFSFVLGHTPGPGRPGSSGNPGRPRRPSPPRSPAAPLGRKGREARETRAGPASRRLPFPGCPLGPKRLLQTKRPPPGLPRGPLPLFSATP